MWKALMDVLGKLDLAYQDILALGEKKRNTLVSVDMKGLEAILEEERELAHEVQILEKQRKGILEQLARTERGVRSDMKLAEMCALAPSRAIELRLQALHKGLDERIRKAQAQSGDNAILAQAALDAVRFHLNRVGGATVDPTYGKSGQGGVSHKKNFDFKA